jgi:DNA repair exonuclease SbcCD ATPase subunit
MKLLRLEVENFLSFAAEALDLPQGLVAVYGQNADNPGAGSNGSGKSALFDAVAWALYGQTLREIGTDDVVRRGAKTATVRLAFEVDGQSFLIERQRGGKSALTLVGPDGTDLSQATIAMTQDKINAILGMDFQLFCTVAAFTQDVLRFARATDKEQKETLEKLLGLDVYGRALEKVRKEINALEPALRIKERQRETEQGGLGVRQQEIDKLRAQRKEAEVTLETVKKGVQDQVADKRQQIAQNGTAMQEAREIAAAANASLSAFAETRSEAVVKHANARAQWANLRTRADNVRRQITIQEQSLEQVTSRIGKPCGECRRPLTEAELGSVAEGIAQQILNLTEEADKITAEIRAAETEVNETQKQVDAERAAAQEVTRARAEHLKAAQEASSIIQDLERENGRLLAEIERVERSGDQYEAALKTYDARIADAEVRLREAESTLKRLDSEIATERETLEYLKFWDKGFGYSGIRSMLLDGVAATLTARTNEYLKVLSGGTLWTEFVTQTTTKTGELREKFEVRVHNAHGAGVYGGNSSGERQRVDLAIALALHEAARARATRSLGFVVLDEIFEHLDEIGCDAVVQMIRREKDKLGTAFVVTHNPAMAQRLGAAIEVTKRDGVSSIVKRGAAGEAACAVSAPPSESAPKAKSSKRARKSKEPTPPASSPAAATAS